MTNLPIVLLACNLIFLLKCNANFETNGNNSSKKNFLQKEQKRNGNTSKVNESQDQKSREILNRARVNNDKTKDQQLIPKNVSNSKKNVLSNRQEQYLSNKNLKTSSNKVFNLNTGRKVFLSNVDQKRNGKTSTVKVSRDQNARGIFNRARVNNDKIKDHQLLPKNALNSKKKVLSHRQEQYLLNKNITTLNNKVDKLNTGRKVFRTKVDQKKKGNNSTVKMSQNQKAREILNRARVNNDKTKDQQLLPKSVSNSKKNVLSHRQEQLLSNKNVTPLNNKVDNLNNSGKVFRTKVGKSLEQEKNLSSINKKKKSFNGNNSQAEIHTKIKPSNKKPSAIKTIQNSNFSDEYQLNRLHALKAYIHSIILSTNANNDSMTDINKEKDKPERSQEKVKLNIKFKEPFYVYNDSSDDIITTTPQNLKQYHQKLKNHNFSGNLFNKKAIDGAKNNASTNNLLKNSSKDWIKKQPIFNSITIDPVHMDPVHKKHTGIGSFHILFNPWNDSDDYLSNKKEKAQDIIKSIELKVSKMHNNEPAKPDRPEQQIPKGLNLEKIGYEDFWERLNMQKQQNGETMEEKFERIEQEMNERMQEARQRSDERSQERQRKYEQEFGKNLYSRNSALISENRNIETPLLHKNVSIRETLCKPKNCTLLNNISFLTFHNKKLHDYIFSKYVNSPKNHKELYLKQGNKLMISNEDEDEESTYKQKIRLAESIPINQEDIEVGALGDSHQWQIISEDSVVKDDTVNNQNKTSVKGSPRNRKKSKKLLLFAESLERENKTKNLLNSTHGNNNHSENSTTYNSFLLHSVGGVLLKKFVDDSFLGTVFSEPPASLNVRKKIEYKFDDENKQDHLKKRLDDTKKFIKNSKDFIRLRRNFIYYPQANIFKQARRIHPKYVTKQNVEKIKHLRNESNFQSFRRSEVSKDEKTIDINLVLPKAETPSTTPPTQKDNQQSLADLIQHTLDNQQKSSANSESSDKNMMNHMVSDLTRALDRQQMTNEINQITNTLAQTMMNSMLLNQRPAEKSSSIVDLEKEVNSLKTRAAVPVESIDYDAAAVPSLSRILKKIKRKNRKLKKLIKKVQNPFLMQPNIMPNMLSQMPTGGVFGGMSGAPQTISQQAPPPMIPNIQQAPAVQPMMVSAPIPPPPPPQIIAAPPPQPQMIFAPPPPPVQMVSAPPPPQVQMISAPPPPQVQMIAAPPPPQTQLVTAEAPTQVVAAEAPTQIATAEVQTQLVAAEAPTQVVAAEAPTQMVAAEAPTQIVAAEAPTQLVAAEAPTQMVAAEAPTQVVTAEAPTQMVAAEAPTQVVAAEAPTQVVAAEAPTQMVAAEAPTQVVADEAPTQVVAAPPRPSTRLVATRPRPPTRLVATRPRPPTRLVAIRPRPLNRIVASRPKLVASQPSRVALQVQQETEPEENVQMQQTPIIQQEIEDEQEQNQIHDSQALPQVVQPTEQVNQDVETPVLTEETQSSSEHADNQYQDFQLNDPGLIQNDEPVPVPIKEKPVQNQYNDPEYQPSTEPEEMVNPDEYETNQNSINEPLPVQSGTTSLSENQQLNPPSQFNQLQETNQEPILNQPYQPVRFPTMKYPKWQRGRYQSFPFRNADYNLANYGDLYKTPNPSGDSKTSGNAYPDQYRVKLKRKKNKYQYQDYNDPENVDNQDSINQVSDQTQNGHNEYGNVHYPPFSKRRKNLKHRYKNKFQTSSETPPIQQPQVANFQSSLDLENKKDVTKLFSKNAGLLDNADDFQKTKNLKKKKYNQKTVLNILMKILQSSKQKSSKKLNDKSLLSKNLAERILLKTAMKANKLLQKTSRPKLDNEKAFLKKSLSIKTIKNTHKNHKTSTNKKLQKKSTEKHSGDKNLNSSFKIPEYIKNPQPVNVWLKSL